MEKNENYDNEWENENNSIKLLREQSFLNSRVSFWSHRISSQAIQLFFSDYLWLLQSDDSLEQAVRKATRRGPPTAWAAPLRSVLRRWTAASAVATQPSADWDDRLHGARRFQPASRTNANFWAESFGRNDEPPRNQRFRRVCWTHWRRGATTSARSIRQNQPPSRRGVSCHRKPQTAVLWMWKASANATNGRQSFRLIVARKGIRTEKKQKKGRHDSMQPFLVFPIKD